MTLLHCLFVASTNQKLIAPDHEGSVGFIAPFIYQWVCLSRQYLVLFVHPPSPRNSTTCSVNEFFRFNSALCKCLPLISPERFLFCRQEKSTFPFRFVTFDPPSFQGHFNFRTAATTVAGGLEVLAAGILPELL